MIKRLYYIIAVLLIFTACSDNSTQPDQIDGRDLLIRLQELPGVEATEIPPIGFYSRAFELNIEQPSDHDNPNGQTFIQKVFLSHTALNGPMVLNTHGYSVTSNRIREISGVLNANQLMVPHRFFDGAMPDNIDWQYLTVQQASADYHHIVTLLKTIYNGVWVNSGISKGGITALIHRRFYPDDVDATVAYVAPIMLSTEDPRFDNYILNEACTEEFRNGLIEFQRACLENRDGIIAYVEEFANNYGYTFFMDYDEAFEYAVAEYSFAFLQYGTGNVNTIPSTNLNTQQMFDYLNNTVGFAMYTINNRNRYQSAYYQFYTQEGYYNLITSTISDLLISAPDPSYSNFAPPGVPLNFDSSLMPEILNWLQTEGNNIIYIYGGIDPFTAA
ncbi:S28 family serine protease, partial [Bacteroidota bacterium]